ncbi:hypothetical protein WJX72_012186 [[Myrmecia] bisecta]|uniref:Uncharacterized protein n=1 Tax=[Myrmecia] bisecta TaxID=41462 RepID=A0AAW1QT75_9CHLO
MGKFKVSAVLPLPAHLYIVERDTAAFRTLLARALKQGRLQFVDSWNDGPNEVVKLATFPHMGAFVPKHLPAQVAGSSDKALVYHDIITYDPQKIEGLPYQLSCTSVPPLFAHRVDSTSTLTIEAVDEFSCRQTLEGRIDISIFGMGIIAERSVIDSLEKVYRYLPQVVDRWVSLREVVLAMPAGHELLMSGRPNLVKSDWPAQDVRMKLKAPFVPPAMHARTASLAKLYSASSSVGAEATLLKATGSLGTPPSVSSPRVGSAFLDRQVSDRFYDASEESLETATAASDVEPQEPTKFYDADSEWHWDEERFVDDATTAESVRGDHQAAWDWYRDFREAGDLPPSLSLRRGHQTFGRKSSDLLLPDLYKQLHHFHRTFNDRWPDWAAFWDSVGVAVADVPNLRIRLAHLFDLAAGWGFVKPEVGGSTPGSRHNSRRPSRVSDQNITTPPGSVAGDSPGALARPNSVLRIAYAVMGAAASSLAQYSGLGAAGYAARASEVISTRDVQTVLRLATLTTLPSLVLQALTSNEVSPQTLAIAPAAALVAIFVKLAVTWCTFRARAAKTKWYFLGASVGQSLSALTFPAVYLTFGAAGLQLAVLYDFVNVLAGSILSYLCLGRAGSPYPAAYAHADGGVYRGQWRGRSKQGLGVYKYPSGARYLGEWLNNQKHGRGVYAYPSGGLYQGEWCNGERHGKGVRLMKSGKMMSGEWRDGKLETSLEPWQCAAAAQAAKQAAKAAQKVEVGGGNLAAALQQVAMQPAVWAAAAVLAALLTKQSLPRTLDTITAALASVHIPLVLLCLGAQFSTASLQRPDPVRPVSILLGRVTAT